MKVCSWGNRNWTGDFLFFSFQLAFCKVKVNIRFLVAEFLALFRFHFGLYADERVPVGANGAVCRCR